MPGKDSNVIRYRRIIRLNIGMIVFIVFFVYVLINILSYMVRPHVQIYEVGAISTVVQDTTYNALILREEAVQLAPTTGYVNAYIREGTRTSVGDVVCLMDENGRYTEMLNTEKPDGESALTNEQLSSLKKKLTAYSAGYRSVRFREVYDIKYSLENQLLSYLSAETLNRISDISVNISYLKNVTSDRSGVVEYYTDGMETLTEENLTSASLNENHYRRTSISSGSTVEKGHPVFKVVTSEKWYLYLPLTPEDQAALTDQTHIGLLFNDINLRVRAAFSLITASDGTILGKCELSDYMIQLAHKRYTSVSVLKSEIPELNKSGLKIPKSAVIARELFVVPRSYAASGGNSNSMGFYKQITPGGPAEFITPTICARSQDYYYIDMGDLTAGTVLLKPSESGDASDGTAVGAAYTVGPTAVVQGAYNINKGFAQFRAIQIRDENDDYYIVESGMAYGLAIYDHILLNGSLAEDGEVLY